MMSPLGSLWDALHMNGSPFFPRALEARQNLAPPSPCLGELSGVCVLPCVLF